MVRARAVLDLADVLDAELERARRDAAAAPRSSCRSSTCWPRWSAPAIAVDAARAGGPRGPLRRRPSRRPPRRRSRSSASEINLGSPKQLQVVLFDELGMPKTKRTKTGYTTDADALADLYAKTEHPFLAAPAAAPGRLPAAADRRGPAQVGVATTGGSTRRTSRRSPPPGGCPAPTRTCRTSRSAPRRAAGSGRRSSSAQGYECAADRRLLPDRDADHGAPLGRRRAHRGVPLGGGPAPLRRVAGLRGRRPAEVTPAMRSKIKAMSYGLAYGLSAFGLSRQLVIPVGGGPRPDGRVLRAVRRRARLPARDRRRGPAHRLHRDDPRAAGATCPT